MHHPGAFARRTVHSALIGLLAGSALWSGASDHAFAQPISWIAPPAVRACDGLERRTSPRAQPLPAAALLGGPEKSAVVPPHTAGTVSPATELVSATTSLATTTTRVTPDAPSASLAVAPARGDEPIATAGPMTAQTISLPLLIDGRAAGDIDAAVDFAHPQSGAVARDALLGALRSALTPAAHARLVSALSGAPAMTPFSAAQAAGLDITFDPGDVAVRVTRRLDDTPVQSVRGAGFEEDRPHVSLRPARVATALNVAVSRSYDWTQSKRAAWLPTQTDLDGYVTIGREHSVTIRNAARFTSDGRLERSPIVAIYDDPARAIRYSAGQIEPQAAEFQSAPRLRGVMVHRAYRDLQPYANLSPTGRMQLALERPAIVTVEVDGIVTRSSPLPRGRYDIRELADGQGLHKVRVLVEDGFGVREAANFDVLVDDNLLGEGMSEFSAAIGSPEGGPIQSPLLATGYYRWAATPRVTALVGGQAYRGNLSGVAEALTPIPGGAVRVAYGANSVGGVFGQSAYVTTNQTFPRPKQATLVLSSAVLAQTPNTGYVESFGKPSAGTRLMMSGSVGYRSPGESYELGAQFSDSRSGHDSWSIGASASRTWGRLTLALRSSIGKTDTKKTDGRIGIVLGLARSAGPNNYSASFGDQESSAQWRSSTKRTLGGRTELSARTQTSDAGTATSAAVGWNGPRFNLGVAQNTGEAKQKDGTRTKQNQTSGTIAFGLAFADGAMAFGVPVRDAFAIATTHRSMGRAKVALGSSTDMATAKSGLLGPPMTNLEVYAPTSITYDVTNLRDGYGLGALDTSAFPRLGSGYVLRVGRSNWMSAMGRLVGDEGPIAGRRILVSRESGKPGKSTKPTASGTAGAANASPIETFTNADGVFFVEGVGVGAYVITAGDAPIARFTITNQDTAMVDLGTLKATSP